MLRASIPLLKIMGVEIRLHLSFLLLLVIATLFGQLITGNATRGLALWGALFFAVCVREIARALASAWLGLDLRAIFLLPVGGILAFAPDSNGPPNAAQPALRPLILAAPMANLAVGLLLLGLAYACAPGVHLLAQPWISPRYILRSLIWMQFAMCLASLLPHAALSARTLLRDRGTQPEESTAQSPTPARAAVTLRIGVLSVLALGVLVTGVFLMNQWLLMLGAFGLLASQFQNQPAQSPTPAGDGMRVEEVMLTDFVMLSASDTLRTALQRTVHTVQDVFPVLRGNRLVGAVSRQTLMQSFQSQGDVYLQGLMARNLQIAAPTEPLVDALRRISTLGASEFIPVAENNRLLGMLTLQSLHRAVQQMKLARMPEDVRDSRP